MTALEFLGLIIVFSLLAYLSYYFDCQANQSDSQRIEASDREYARKHPIR